jgi:hypothetical protein
MTAPQDSPQDDRADNTDSSNSVLFVCDTPGDTTRRPARPNLPPPDWRGQRLDSPEQQAAKNPLPAPPTKSEKD